MYGVDVWKQRMDSGPEDDEEGAIQYVLVKKLIMC
tara:strand:- start:298 stop:402 length:105 start_codon:yes stop_codon:yes gene_type:complete